MDLPFSIIIISLLLVSVFIIFSLSPLMGDESPTSKILLLLRKKKKMSTDQIQSEFNNEQMIKKRLVNMVNLGWIKQNEKRFTVQSRGQQIASLILSYRKLLGWNTFG